MKSQKKIAGPKQAANHRFYEAIASIKTAAEAKLFFEDLCTPAERQAMVDRWQVVKKVKEDKPYRQIYAETGVSVTTIGRVARCLAFGTGGYALIFNRLFGGDKREKKKKT